MTANSAHLHDPGSSATIFHRGARTEVPAGTTPVAVAIGHVLEGQAGSRSAPAELGVRTVWKAPGPAR